MLRSLFPQINWSAVKYVGFDLDGTLYDELDFIVQVYRPISEHLAKFCGKEQNAIYAWMVNRWLEKGSSYNHIFEEVLHGQDMTTVSQRQIIWECLSIYRQFRPNLDLSPRVRWLLDVFRSQYCLFLITDGNQELQSAKITELGLLQWFTPDQIAISGQYGSDYQKPSDRMITKIMGLSKSAPNSVVYFGDRQVDEEFAQKAGFSFVLVNCMQAVQR